MLEFLGILVLSLAVILVTVGIIGFPVIMAIFAAYNGQPEEARAWVLIAILLYFVALPLSKSKKASAEKEKTLTPEEKQTKAEKDELARANSERLRKQLQLHRTIQNMQGYDARCPRCGSADISVTKKQATTDYTWEDGIGIDGRWALVPMPTPGKPKVFMRCNRCGKKFKL